MNNKFRSNLKLVSLMLRVGLAIVFMYAAISAFRQPNAWVSFIPSFSNKFLAAKTALDIISVAQIILAVILLSGRYIKYAALISAILLLGIVVFNLNALLITFRDIGLAFMAIALVLIDKDIT